MPGTSKVPPFYPKISSQSLLVHLNYTSVTAHCDLERQDWYDQYDRYNWHHWLHNEYEDNQYDRSDKLTLHTSPTQWHHCCFLFRFPWMIKVSSIVVLQYSVIFLVHSPLLRILLLFATQSYSGTNIWCNTALPTRNWFFLCISRSDVSSWLSTTNRTLLLCSRIYQLQQVVSDNHAKCYSRWWSSNQWFSPFNLVVWQGWYQARKGE